MTKSNPPPLGLFAAGAFVCLGLLTAGLILGNGGGGSPTPTPTATEFALPKEAEIDVLLIGVTDIKLPNAPMESCWVMRLFLDTPEHYLIGFSPATTVTLPGQLHPRRLDELYAESQKLQMGESRYVWEAVNAVIHADTDVQFVRAEMIFDHSALSSTVDMLGGLAVDDSGELFKGAQLLERQHNLETSDPQAELELQRKVMEALIHRAENNPPTWNGLQPFIRLGQLWRPSENWVHKLIYRQVQQPRLRFSTNLAPLQITALTPTPP